MAALHQQRQQTDTVNGQDEEDSEFDPRAASLFLIECCTLGNERTLIIHFNSDGWIALIEVMDCGWVYSGVLPQKTPK